MKLAANEVSFLQNDRIVQSNMLFDGVILQLYVQDVTLEDGMVVNRELIHHKPAVAILAEKEEKVVLVKQFRHAANQFMWEIPAGILDKGDESAPLIGAKRELEEETTYQSIHWTKISEFYVSPGFLNEKITVYYAKDVYQVENPLPQDDDEDIEIQWFSKSAIQDMLADNTIIDAKTIIALQYWLGQFK